MPDPTPEKPEKKKKTAPATDPVPSTEQDPAASVEATTDEAASPAPIIPPPKKEPRFWRATKDGTFSWYGAICHVVAGQLIDAHAYGGKDGLDRIRAGVPLEPVGD